jgi:hypothetical protein
MWGYPYTLWLFVAVSLWFIANALITQPRPSLMAFVIVAAGPGLIASGAKQQVRRGL